MTDIRDTMPPIVSNAPDFIPAFFRGSHVKPAENMYRVERHSDGSIDCTDIAYGIPLGFRPLRLDLHVPAGGAAPLMIYIHGGAFIAGSHHADDVVHPHKPIRKGFVDAGYAFASVSYRFAGEGAFPMGLHDCLAAVRWLRTYGTELGIDVSKIAVLGESAGGHMAAFVGLNLTDPEMVGNVGGLECSSHVDVCVPWYPPVELGAQPGTQVDGDRDWKPEDYLIGARVDRRPDLARRGSPLHHVGSASHAPMLFQHGDADMLVPTTQSEKMHSALLARGYASELDIVPGGDHAFTTVDCTPVVARAVAFCDRHLGR